MGRAVVVQLHPLQGAGEGGVPPLHQELQDKAAVFTGQNK